MGSTCLNCSKELPVVSNLNFCPFCKSAIKCKNCGETLIKGASCCYSCGTDIISTETNRTTLNEIEFEQKGDSKKFKALFTDNVGHDLVSTFGGMVGIQPMKKKTVLLTASTSSSNQPIILSDNAVDAEILEDEDEFKEALMRVFKVDGDKLILQMNSLKDRNKIDKSIRVSLLTLLAFKLLHNIEGIKTAVLNEVLKKSKLYNANFRRWISKCDEIVKDSSGLISLTPSGRDIAVNILKEVFDQNVTEGVATSSLNTSNNKARRTKKSNSEEGASSGRASKVPRESLQQLIDEGFFNEKRTLSDIITHLKDSYALTYKTTDISGPMGKLANQKVLSRTKGANGYEYFNPQKG